MFLNASVKAINAFGSHTLYFTKYIQVFASVRKYPHYKSPWQRELLNTTRLLVFMMPAIQCSN